MWEYKLLIKILLYAVTKVSNIASVYGSYLKYYKKCSLDKLYLDTKLIDKMNTRNDIEHASYNMNISNLLNINDLSGYEVVYIDPPYFPGGTQATATAVLNAVNGTIMSIIIGVAGSGYSPSNPPYIPPPGTIIYVIPDGGNLLCNRIEDPCTGEILDKTRNNLCFPTSCSDVPGKIKLLCWSGREQVYFPKVKRTYGTSGNKWPVNAKFIRTQRTNQNYLNLFS
jgi:hypothetical protein